MRSSRLDKQLTAVSDTGKYPTDFKLGDSGLCMGVQQSPLADGAPVVLMDCSAGYDHTTWSAPNGKICLLGTSECFLLSLALPRLIFDMTPLCAHRYPFHRASYARPELTTRLLPPA